MLVMCATCELVCATCELVCATQGFIQDFLKGGGTRG